MIRLGLLSDLHCELEPAGSRWINVFEPERLDERIDEALSWFRESGVAAILLLGDLVQLGDPLALEHVLGRLAESASAPLVMVSGNHDLRLGDDFAAGAKKVGIDLLREAPLELDGVAVAGVGLGRSGPGLPFYVGDYAPPTAGGMLVMVSHFPLLSEAECVAAAGIPYAGDLVNRGDLVSGLLDAPGPTVAVSGHIHARCSRAEGPLLQYTVGALIEPPFDCTVIELDLGDKRVRRIARRLGPVSRVDPVFAADEETWAWSERRWELEPA